VAYTNHYGFVKKMITPKPEIVLIDKIFFIDLRIFAFY